MDNATKKYVEDVLKVLGQMEHKRDLHGKMTMDVTLRQDLIERGSEIIGLFPVGSYKDS